MRFMVMPSSIITRETCSSSTSAPFVVLGVRDRRLEHLLQRDRGFLVAELQQLKRLGDVQAADLVRDQTRLLRRNANVLLVGQWLAWSSPITFDFLSAT